MVIPLVSITGYGLYCSPLRKHAHQLHVGGDVQPQPFNGQLCLVSTKVVRRIETPKKVVRYHYVAHASNLRFKHHCRPARLFHHLAPLSPA